MTEISMNGNPLEFFLTGEFILFFYASIFFLLRHPTRQSDREFATVHHVVEEELSTQPTIILFFCRLF